MGSSKNTQNKVMMMQMMRCKFTEKVFITLYDRILFYSILEVHLIVFD